MKISVTKKVELPPPTFKSLEIGKYFYIPSYEDDGNVSFLKISADEAIRLWDSMVFAFSPKDVVFLLKAVSIVLEEV